jgi:hypothetical protein
MDQSAQQIASTELKVRGSLVQLGLGGLWRREIQPTVRPGGVVVLGEDA